MRLPAAETEKLLGKIIEIDCKISLVRTGTSEVADIASYFHGCTQQIRPEWEEPKEHTPKVICRVHCVLKWSNMVILFLINIYLSFQTVVNINTNKTKVVLLGMHICINWEVKTYMIATY